MTAVGLVCLAEGGNLGDDLIAVAAVQAIIRAVPDARVIFTSFGKYIDWQGVGAELGFVPRLERFKRTRDFPLISNYCRPLAECAAIVFGGGGLLQTSHHPLRPYHWLRYLPSGAPPVLACGLGLGPLSRYWEKQFRSFGNPFSETFLRDDASVVYGRTALGWESSRCRDFVDSSFLGSISGSARRPGEGSVLGVAVRAWPGLRAEEVARVIELAGAEYRTDHVKFFVLESDNLRGVDVEFARAIAALLHNVPTVNIYSGREPTVYARSMQQCRAAISMKLHSSAIWSHSGVDMYPIVYSPKVASFFGLKYRGLEVFSSVVRPPAEQAKVPRSQDVIASRLPSLVNCRQQLARASIPRAKRLLWQTVDAAFALERRMKTVSSEKPEAV